MTTTPTAYHVTLYNQIPVDLFEGHCSCFSAQSQRQYSSEVDTSSSHTIAGFTISQERERQCESSLLHKYRCSIPPTAEYCRTCGDASASTNSQCQNLSQEYGFVACDSGPVMEQNNTNEYQCTSHSSPLFSTVLLSSQFTVGPRSSAPVTLCEALNLSRESPYTGTPVCGFLGDTVSSCYCGDGWPNARDASLPKYNGEEQESLGYSITNTTTNNTNNVASFRCPLDSTVLFALQEQQYERESVGIRSVAPVVTVAEALRDVVAFCEKEPVDGCALHSGRRSSFLIGPNVGVSSDASLPSFSQSWGDSPMEPLPEGGRGKRSGREDWPDRGLYRAAHQRSQEFALLQILERYGNDMGTVQGS